MIKSGKSKFMGLFDRINLYAPLGIWIEIKEVHVSYTFNTH